MAILSPGDLQELRHALERDGVPITYTKPTINAAAQAVEAWFAAPATRAAIASAIDTATAPVILTPAQKAALVKHWLRKRFELGG